MALHDRLRVGEEREREEDQPWHDLDTDEIRSTASDELYHSRPNRWRGAPSTWRHFTEEERLLHESMEQLRNQDLAVHLYNAFALRNRPNGPVSAAASGFQAQGRQPTTAELSLEQMLGGGEWRPQHQWTAWPMPASKVPVEGLLRETRDENEASTFRTGEPWMPGRALEEEITASVLRAAKDRFQGRGLGTKEASALGRTGERRSRNDEQDGNDAEFASAPEQGSRAASLAASEALATLKQEVISDFEALRQDHADDHQEAEDDNVGEPHDSSAHVAEQDNPDKRYVPVVSADDELSRRLLQPSVRHILATLDNTLATLHHARMAGIEAVGQHDDSASDVSSYPSVSQSRRTTKPAKKASKRGRSAVASENAHSDAVSSGDEFADDESVSDGEASSPGQRSRNREKSQSRPLGKGKKREKSANMSESEYEQAHAQRERTLWKEQRLGRWGLRDWRDVLSAGAVSGFEPEVIARAAQRCADIFGQSLELRSESTGDSKAMKGSTKFVPGGRAASSAALQDRGDEEEEEEEEEEEAHLDETRRRNRLKTITRRRRREKHLSRARALGVDPESLSDDEDFRTADEGLEQNSRRSGVASGGGFTTNDEDETSATGASAGEAKARIDINTVEAAPDSLFYCPITHCKRHNKGFPVKRGLREHYRLVHDQASAERVAFYCPVVECRYHRMSFKTRKNLRAHVKNMHGAQAIMVEHPRGDKGDAEGVGVRENAPVSGGLGSEDEIEAGVHVDGFLRPIKVRSGWLAKGGREKGTRNKRSKQAELRRGSTGEE